MSFNIKCFILVLITCIGQSAVAQQTIEQKLLVIPASKQEHAVDLSWDSVVGRTYFLQYTNDLRQSWQFMPLIESGDSSKKEVGITSEDPRGFFRLNYTDQPTTDPINDDFDGDGLSNWDEIKDGGTNTNPLKFSTAGDGVSDGLIDPDLDGLTNIEELLLGTNPHQYDEGPFDTDSDNDGILDFIEIAAGLDPNNAWDAYNDLDGDGVINITEFQNGTKLDNQDSNNDGILDGDTHSPTEDRDYDTFSFTDELSYQTNPYSLDTDGDGIPDWLEMMVSSLSPINPIDGNQLIDGTSQTYFEQYFYDALEPATGATVELSIF